MGEGTWTGSRGFLGVERKGMVSYPVVMSFLTWSYGPGSNCCLPGHRSQHMTSPWLEEKAGQVPGELGAAPASGLEEV